MKLTYKKILVTGGAGFIGSAFVRFLRKQSPQSNLVVLDKLTYAGNLVNLKDVRGDVEFVQGDICDPDVVQKTIAGCDAVVNFAAESHVDRSFLDAMPFLETNIRGTVVLLESAKQIGVRRFLQVSTDEVYGDVSGSSRLSKESDPLNPRSPYAASKAAAEHLVLAYGASFGMDVVVTRGSNTYGPYQYPEKIIPLFIANARDNKDLPLYGDGSAVRDYMYVDDHCSGIAIVLDKGLAGQVYNLGARLQMNGVAVADAILGLLGKPQTLKKFVQDRPGHDYRYAVDPSKAEKLGWKRRWTFDDGIAATVQWYAQNGEWLEQIRRNPAYAAYLAAVYKP